MGGFKARFLTRQAAFDPDQRPTPTGLGDHGRWSTIAKQILEDKDDLSRVANIRKTQIKLQPKWHHHPTRPGRINRSLPAQDESIDIRNTARPGQNSSSINRPAQAKIRANQPKRKLQARPRPLATAVTPRHLVRHGGLPPHSRRPRVSIRSHLPRPTRSDAIDLPIYHYAAYEVSAMRKLMGRFGTREMEVDNLLRNEVFVDLYRVVQQGLRVGEPRYSLKNIEHLYMPKRAGDVSKATDSIVYYERWLEQQDGDVGSGG